MRFTSTIAAGVLAIGAAAQEGKNYLGFNTGATLADGSAKVKKDFLAEFRTANNLKNAPGDFNSARLYTNIQAETDNDPISAFEAAIETDTNLLLGVWASGTDNIDNEIAALEKAVDQYGSKLTDLVIGITIGSEDLYRNSVQGVKNKAGVGNSPKAIVSFIDDFKKAFKGSPLAQIPVGHADTWDAWENSTSKAVIDAIDFVAVHEYPYYEDGKGNHIDNAGALFDRAYETTLAVAGGKPVWVTETGWPYIGKDWDEAEASVKNAEKYWQEVGCKKLFNKTPTFWYTLRDSNPDNQMKFAITDNLSTEPRWDLKCKSTKDTPKDSPKSTSVSGPSSTMTTATPSKTAGSGSGQDEDEDEEKETGNGSGSGSGNGVGAGNGNAGNGNNSSDDDEEETGNDSKETGNGSGSGSGSGNGAGSDSDSGSGSGSDSNDSEEAEDDAEDGEGEGEGAGSAATSTKVSLFGMIAVAAAGMTLF